MARNASKGCCLAGQQQIRVVEVAAGVNERVGQNVEEVSAGCLRSQCLARTTTVSIPRELSPKHPYPFPYHCYAGRSQAGLPEIRAGQAGIPRRIWRAMRDATRRAISTLPASGHGSNGVGTLHEKVRYGTTYSRGGALLAHGYEGARAPSLITTTQLDCHLPSAFCPSFIFCLLASKPHSVTNLRTPKLRAA